MDINIKFVDKHKTFPPEAFRIVLYASIAYNFATTAEQRDEGVPEKSRMTSQQGHDRIIGCRDVYGFVLVHK